MTAATLMNSGLMLTGLNLPDGQHADVGIRHGRFTDARDARQGALEYIALDGCLLLPGLVDAHLHLDKTLLGGPWLAHSAADSIAAQIENERRLRSSFVPSVRERANLLLEMAVSQGTVALRTHVDIDDDIGLTNLEAILDLRRAWSGKVEIQVVAFPQGGILRRPSVPDLLDAALHAGADLVGGLDPQAVDLDRNAHLKIVFDLASKHAKGIDIHLHESGAEGAESLRHIARLTRQHGLAGQVTVSHAFCLGAFERDDARSLADELALSGVAIVTAAPGAAPMPPIDLLRDAGVRVAAGSDNVRDVWSPFGNASMLERCMLVAYRSGWRTDEALTRTLDLATTEAAALLELDDYGFGIGKPATGIVVPSEHVPQAIIERPAPKLVLSSGVVLRNTVGIRSRSNSHCE
jgi:cytosine/adenosine deaminase-related metal-dependent hydrolase